jgi:hypothetical protein
LTGGSAIFSLVNGETGGRYPYRIAAPKVQDQGREVYFTRAVLAPGAEPEYLGYFRTEPDGSLSWRTSAKSATGPAAEAMGAAIAIVNQRLKSGQPLTPYVIEYDGKCSRCRATITNPTEVERGRHAHACIPPLRRGRPGGWPKGQPQPAPTPAPSPGPLDPSPHGTPEPEGDEPEPTPAPAPPEPPAPAPDPDLPLTPAQVSLAKAFQALAAAVGGSLGDKAAAAAAHIALSR